MMPPEKEVVDGEAGVESALKHSVGNGKSGQQLLSFRSRKLLRSNLSKERVASDIDKRAGSTAGVLPSTTELSHLERSGTRTKVLHGEATTTKARRTLWDPRRIESESSKVTSRSSCQQSGKGERNSSIRDEQIIEDSEQSDHGVVVARSKQQLKAPKLQLLETFYEGLEAACCLLRIRHQMCTFRALCKIVESMSKRRFLLKHLAQIKHIFSEVLQLEYVRCQDPDSWGERWDLRVTLRPLSSDCPYTSSPLKGSAGQTPQTIRRRKEFHARLLNFESSHPEDRDIPLEPLPRRPNSATSPSLPASPPRDRMSESSLSVQGGIPEASTQPPAAEPRAQTRMEEFEFSIVKPSRCTDTVSFDGTSHFFPSFRPFYSSVQTAQIVDDAAVRRSKVQQRFETLPFESHFPASFRPSFSAGLASETINEQSKKAPPEEAPVGSCCEGKCEEGGIQSQSGSLAVFPRRSVSVNPSSPVPPSTPVPTANSRELPSASGNSSSPLSPSTPILTVKSKGLPSSGTDPSRPELLRGDAPLTPVPISTPPFQSPMDKKYSSNQASSNKSPCEMPMTNSSKDPVATKSHGTMRSLRFASPVRGSLPVKSDVSDAFNRTKSLGPASSAVNTPPSDACYLKFDHTSVSTPSTPAHIGPGTPETPSLQTPVRVFHSKEIMYSPPKRTKLNQRSLFTNAKEKHQEPCLLGSSIGGARESCTKAVSGGLTSEHNYSDSPQEEASIPSVLYATAKDKEAISESDLDVIHSLPHDIVQSVWEKERKIKDDTNMELAKQKRRQQMMSGVLKLFNQLRLIFQSLNRTVLPEHELIKTLLASHPEITDKGLNEEFPLATDLVLYLQTRINRGGQDEHIGEIEERLKLVIELAPDYIQTRSSYSSELLYRIDKRADIAQIQRKLSGRSGKEF